MFRSLHDMNVLNMLTIGSDHAPLPLDTHYNKTHSKSGFYKFKVQWLLDPTFFYIGKNVCSCYSEGSYAY